MNILFYIASVIAVIATLIAITGKRAVHSLLYLIVSLIAIAVVFFTLGAPFAAAFEIISYAGAIMILLVFVVMLLNLRKEPENRMKLLFSFKTWLGPVILTAILLLEFCISVASVQFPAVEMVVIGPKQVGTALFGTYVLGVELAGMLLMSGIVGAYHIGRKKQREYHRFLKDDNLE